MDIDTTVRIHISATMSVLLSLSVLLVTIVTGLYYYFTRTFKYWEDRGVPGPKPVILFGNIKDSALRRKNIGIVFKELYDAYPNEKVVGIYRMTKPCLLIRDLDVIKHIMIKDFDIFADRGVQLSKKGLGLNLFHADAETWRLLRSHFTPLFSSSKLKNMLHLMNERADHFINYVQKLCSQQSEQDCQKLLRKYTISVVTNCVFGLDIDTLSDSDIMKTLLKIDNLVLIPSFANELDMMYPGILKAFNSTIIPTFVTNFFYDLVKNIKKQRNGVPSNRKDFMDYLLEINQQRELLGTSRNVNKQLAIELTDDVIAAQAFVFFVGGYESSTTTMGFMLYELAKNPDIQEKVIAEVDEVISKHNGQVTYEALQEMVYLGKVFDETLRLYTVLDPTQRNALVDYKVPGTDVTIKKGTTVLVSLYGIHRDEKYYPDPEKFDPERHSPENSSNRHPCAYLPFGVGPRNCIGMRFAKIQSSVCMVKFFSKFRVTPCKDTKMVMKMAPKRLIMGPDGGIPLNIIVREEKR